MAKCRTKPADVEYELTLTGPEARVLRFLCGRIEGSGNHSRRGLTNTIFHALGEAGVATTENLKDTTTEGIMFHDSDSATW